MFSVTWRRTEFDTGLRRQESTGPDDYTDFLLCLIVAAVRLHVYLPLYDRLSITKADLSEEAVNRARLDEMKQAIELNEPTEEDVRRDGQSALATVEAYGRAVDGLSEPQGVRAPQHAFSMFGFGGTGVRGASIGGGIGAAVAPADALSTLITTHGSDLTQWKVPQLKEGLRHVGLQVKGNKADLSARLSSSALFKEKLVAAVAGTATGGGAGGRGCVIDS